MWFIHEVEYYSVLKRDEIFLHIAIWMDLENMLSEISQTQKDKSYKYVWFYFYKIPTGK